VLIGIGLFLNSFFFSEGYSPQADLITNIRSMELVIYTGRIVTPDMDEIDEMISKGEITIPKVPDYSVPGEDAEVAFRRKQLIETTEKLLIAKKLQRIEGKLLIPFKYLLSLSTIITLVGIGLILLSKNKNETA
jgi:hypothetical protein